MSYFDNDHMTVTMWKFDNNNTMKIMRQFDKKYDNDDMKIWKWKYHFGNVTFLQWQDVNNDIRTWKN